MKYLLALLVCLGFAASSLADDHIVIVFDNSGSMGETMRGVGKTRIKVAQDSLIAVMNQVPSTTKVGILTFTGWIYDLQTVDKAAITVAIRNTLPNCPSGTPLYLNIRAGATRLLAERQKNNNSGSYKMLVVTDGEANKDDALLNNDSQFPDGSVKPGVLKDIIGRAVVVDCIGMEIPNEHALHSQINGSYMPGNDPKSLTKAIHKSVAEVGFAQTKDATDDAFRDIAELPDEFVAASIKGLTTFRNWEIGGQKPIETVLDTSGSYTPNQQQAPVVAATESNAGFYVMVVCGCLLGLVVLIKLVSS